MEAYIPERKCAMCQKTLYPKPGWVYKIADKKDKRVKWYCSYKCWRKDGGGSGGRTIKFEEY